MSGRSAAPIIRIAPGSLHVHDNHDHDTAAGRRLPGALSRRSVIAGGLALAATPALLACEPEGTAAYPDRTEPANPCNFGYDWPRPPTQVHNRPIMYPVLPDPVLGAATWTDTYLAPRGSGGCRYHEGQDLMGRKMLKLLACVDGTIVDVRHRSTGNALTIRDDQGWYYVYLHINDDDPGTNNNLNQFRHAFAPGMALGKRVRQGEHVAFLGASGNASDNAPHLHFEIRVPNSSQWKAAAVNPKFSLERAVAARQT
jgi:murein DD-endopeptidase MepM/ murein hydrolase activator NlpD